MSIDLSKLNPEQKQAVKNISTPLLVLAGAGSGKTGVITQKIAYLIQKCQVPAHRILAVTFTNKAAREMKERVKGMLPKSETRGLAVCTFHRFGLNVLAKEYKKLGYKSGFSLFDDKDTYDLIAQLSFKDEEVGADDIKRAQFKISHWKNNLIAPKTAQSHAEDDEELLDAHLYERYVQMLKACNALDFDDLILKPVELFKQDEQALQKWQAKTYYLLIDEYQDTNEAQYQLFKLLTGQSGRFTVVGDDDQSIYAWRGARPENLNILKADFPKLEVIKLEQNYRSSSNILNAANQVIANNPHLFDKKLWSQHAKGEPLLVKECKDDLSEAEWVASDIVNRQLKERIEFKDFAILYRSNHQARILETKLQEYQIPYKLSGTTSFFAKTEIKNLLAYLRLILNTDDDNAFLRIINTPRRDLGAKTLERLGEYASLRDQSMFACCQELGLREVLAIKQVKRLHEFADWIILQQRAFEDTDQPMQVLNQLLTDLDYYQWVYENSNTSKQAEKRVENIGQLLSSIENMLDKNPDQSIEDVIKKLVLFDILDQQEEADDTNRVALMTLHASKGLEFPHVYLIGVEENILPHANSIESDTVEEERRLMYVGITRAKQTLNLSYSQYKQQYGEKQSVYPSRFIDELPDDDIIYETSLTQKSPEQEQQVAQMHLDHLMNFLD